MKIVLWLLSAAVVIIIFLNLWGGLTYGYGLGDTYYVGRFVILVLVIGGGHIVIKKDLITIILLFLLLVYNLLLMTIYRGSEYPWNGEVFLSYSNLESENRIEKIILSPKGDSIYITARFWGITGDHEEIIFSEEPIILPPNKDKHYIFYRDEVFYKFENNDELVIHAPKSGKSIPKIPFKNIKVVLKDLKTGDDIRNISENYKKYKLEKIGVRGGD